MIFSNFTLFLKKMVYDTVVIEMSSILQEE